jgi:hypothetical protein
LDQGKAVAKLIGGRRDVTVKEMGKRTGRRSEGRRMVRLES